MSHLVSGCLHIYIYINITYIFFIVHIYIHRHVYTLYTYFIYDCDIYIIIHHLDSQQLLLTISSIGLVFLEISATK